MANYVVGQWRWKGLSARHRVEPLSGNKNLTVNTFAGDVCIQDDSWLVDITAVGDVCIRDDSWLVDITAVCDVCI